MRRLIPLFIFVVTFVTFLPALKGDFVNWDDDVLFVNNPDYRGLGPAQIGWMFTVSILGHYQPVTWLTHGLDYCIWGMNPFGYHLTNLLVHAACAVLVYFLALRVLLLSRTREPDTISAPAAPLCQTSHDGLAAALAALLFALHPLRVESVAWITERRDLVCTFFLVPAILCYLRYAVGHGDPILWLIASILLYVLSLLSKAWGITLPAVLLVLDVYPLRRFRLDARHLFSQRNRAILLEKIPYAIPALLIARTALKCQSYAGMESLAQHTPLQRLAQAGYGVVFYLAKTLWPFNLNPIYEFPVPFDPLAPRFVVPVVALVVLLVFVIALRRRLPSLVAVLTIYFIILSPVLGFTQSGPQLVADRYTYLACIPIAIFIAAAVFNNRAIQATRFALLFLLAGLAALTWRQCAVWRDSKSLWQHAIALDPDSCNARNNLGILLLQEKRFGEARPLFQSCVDRRPDHPLFYCNLAAAEKGLGLSSNAVDHFRRALDLHPTGASKLLIIAQGLHDLGDQRHALEAARFAVQADTSEPRAQFAVGQILTQLGHSAEAAPYLQKAVELLERKLPPGDLDPRGDPSAGMFADACSMLADYYERNRDADRAIIYRDKAQRARGQ